jgi:bla regulator protein BlaR1
VIVQVFAYAILVALLAGLAAAGVERSLAELGLPRRFAWLSAYAGALAFPAAALWLAAGASPSTGTSFPIGDGLVPAWHARVDWDTTLVVAWAASTLLMLFVYLGAWLRLTVIAKRWPRIDSGSGPVAVSDDVGPAVLGILEPRVVLPRWLIDGPASARHVVMAHEREHIAARDPAFIVTSQLITILLPWNLPLWWFARRLRAAIEIDCDARVLRTGVDPAHYGDVLLAVGQRGSASPRMAATLIESATQLERRIRIMLAKPRPGSRRRVVTALAVALGVAACATQVEPPVVVRNAGTAVEIRPGAMEVTARTIEVISDQAPASAEDRERTVITARDEGRVHVQAPASPEDRDRTIKITALGEGRLHVKPDLVRLTSDRISKTADAMVFEGNVQLEFDGMSITTDRAVATVAPDGRTILALDDAKVTRRE